MNAALQGGIYHAICGSLQPKNCKLWPQYLRNNLQLLSPLANFEKCQNSRQDLVGLNWSDKFIMFKARKWLKLWCKSMPVHSRQLFHFLTLRQNQMRQVY